MKVIVHHLPTGCKWEAKPPLSQVEIFIEEVFNKEVGFIFKNDAGFVLRSKTECIYFPADVVAQSVIKVIE